MIFGTTPLALVRVRPAFIGTGPVVPHGVLTAKGFDTWTAASLAPTVAAGITGFRRPFGRASPPHNLAIVALAACGIDRLAGMWRAIFVATRDRQPQARCCIARRGRAWRVPPFPRAPAGMLRRGMANARAGSDCPARTAAP